MLKSCRSFERSQRSNAWKLEAFETVESSPRYLTFIIDFEVFEGSTALRFRPCWTLWDFNVERSEISTSNALRFDVERSEILTSNAGIFQSRTLGDFESSKSLNTQSVLSSNFRKLFWSEKKKNGWRWYGITIPCIFSVYILKMFWNSLVPVWLFHFNLFVYSMFTFLFSHWHTRECMIEYRVNAAMNATSVLHITWQLYRTHEPCDSYCFPLFSMMYALFSDINDTPLFAKWNTFILSINVALSKSLSVRRRTLFESFSFEQTAIDFKSL